MLGPLLTSLRDKHNLTNAEIAERSGLTTSTVRRILSGDTQGPSIDNVKDIVLAMDEPIETLYEIMSAAYGMPTPATAPQTPEDISEEHTEYESWLNASLVNLYVERLAEKDERITDLRQRLDNYRMELAAHDEKHKTELAELGHEYDAKLAALTQEHKEALAQKDKWIHRLFIVALVFIVFLIGLMVFDLLNPHVGYFIRETLEAMQ